VRSLRIGPLLVAVAVCVLFALFGTALIGESLGNWYGALDKPWFLIPLWAFGIVGAIYYVLFATVLYRILVHVDDHRGRIASLVLTIIVLFLNELWNFGFFGLESTLVGFLDMPCFWFPLRHWSWHFAATNGSQRHWSPSTGYGYFMTLRGRSRFGG
jgi:tryptophan-rich sensory protein